LKGDATIEQQAAIHTLAKMGPPADPVMTGLLEQLLAGSLAPELQLDLLEAAGKRADAGVKQKLAKYNSSLSKTDPLATFRTSLHGGDAERGKAVFTGFAQTQCMRCHKIDKHGGDAGPDLSKISEKNPRQYLLEAIVSPSAKIAKGFETISVVTDDGKVFSGVIKSETDTHVHLVDIQGKPIAIAKASIEQRSKTPKSSMPEGMTKLLTRQQLRDLIEYLAQRK
jgi:quinoprotein glucose dehydrogenase